MNYDFDGAKSERKFSTTGKILLGITGGVAVGLSVICASFVAPALRKICLPYVPATEAQIRNVLRALQGSHGKVVDLGSGDGRIVREVAKHNFESHGVELNFWLVLYSKLSVLNKNFTKKPQFYRENLWNFNLTPYNNVIIFGVEEMMRDLEKKFENELQKDSNVIACRFPLPNWKPLLTIGEGVDTVWLYKK